MTPLVALLAGCPERYCGDCFPLYLGPLEELEEHDLVFIGAIESFGEDTRGCDTDLVTRIRIEESFAGARPGERVTVPRGECQHPVSLGERWLVFTDRSSPMLNPCVHTLQLRVGARFEYCVAPEDGGSAAPDFDAHCPVPWEGRSMSEDEVLDLLRRASR